MPKSEELLGKLTEDMLKSSMHVMRCYSFTSIINLCGCGMIHGIFYACKHHHKLLKSNMD